MSFDLPLLQSRLSRREFFSSSGIGFGSIALASLLHESCAGESGLHHVPRACRVIYLHMIGAPSQLDLFDEKPELVKRHNEPCPPEVTKGRDFAFIGKTSALAGSRGSSPGMARPGIPSLSYCLTWPRWPTSYPSYVRFIPKRSTMPPHKCFYIQALVALVVPA